MAISSDLAANRPSASERRARIEADGAWERAQEKAMRAFQDGNADEARANWSTAMSIAERNFERGDPRLATSFTCHGYALLRQDHIHRANVYFQSAIDAWDDAWRWIPMMTPSSPASDGDDAEPYDQAMQDAFYAMVDQGKSITEAIMQNQRLPEAASDDWLTVKPKTMNDVRRLFGAVFLMPTLKR
jgi:hypothetical protein